MEIAPASLARPVFAPPRTWREALLACAELRRGDAAHRARNDALLACVRPEGPTAAALAGAGPADWDEVADHALDRSLRLAPLVYGRLSAAGLLDLLPEGARSRLAAAHAAAAEGNARRFEQLAGILALLDGVGVPVAVLKGPVLAEHVYEHPALRAMNDLDLLVPRAHLPAAERLLIGLGYGPEEAWRPSVEWACEGSHNLWEFWKDGASGVDVHWTLENPGAPFEIDIAGVWERARPARLVGREVPALAVEDFLLHLCLHAGYQHGFMAPFRCYCDIGLLVARSPGLDWDRLAERAVEWRAGRIVFAALSVAARLTGADVPPQPLGALRGRTLDGLVAEVIAEHTLRAAPWGAAEWLTSRWVIDAWMRDVVGVWPRPGGG